MGDIPFADNGVPDGLPLTFCRRCEADVKPGGKGRCPRCGTFLRMNFVARKHPVNVARRDELLTEIVAEFQPSNVIERRDCEDLAAVCEQLESLKPGSAEWTRLIQAKRMLAASLKGTPEESSVREETPTRAELIARVERLLKVLTGDKDAGIRASAQRNAEMQWPVVPIPICVEPQRENGAPLLVVPDLYGDLSEADVQACLKDLGDNVLADYLAGTLPRSEARAMTAAWLKQIKELKR